MDSASHRAPQRRQSNFVPFLVFGGATALFCAGIGAVTYMVVPKLGFVYINLIASVAGILVNFILNYLFNFGGKGASTGFRGELLRFSGVAVAVLLIAALLSVLVEAIFDRLLPVEVSSSLGTRMAGHALVLLLAAIISFAGHSRFTFKLRTRQ